MDEKIKQQVYEIIEKESRIQLSDLDPDKDLREQVALDSMQFVGIIARVEEGLQIELPISIMEVATLNEFLDIVCKELKSTKI